LFATNTAAFIHDMDEAAISNVAGASNYVRVQVLTPVGVLDRDKQLASSTNSRKSSRPPPAIRACVSAPGSS
jgi:hypothetical protein